MKKELKDRIYVLKGNTAPLSFMLASRHTRRYPLLHFDNTTQINRELRYARNQKSPFVDEQDNNAIVEPIVFEDGILAVSTTPFYRGFWNYILPMGKNLRRGILQ